MRLARLLPLAVGGALLAGCGASTNGEAVVARSSLSRELQTVRSDVARGHAAAAVSALRAIVTAASRFEREGALPARSVVLIRRSADDAISDLLLAVTAPVRPASHHRPGAPTPSRRPGSRHEPRPSVAGGEKTGGGPVFHPVRHPVAGGGPPPGRQAPRPGGPIPPGRGGEPPGQAKHPGPGGHVRGPGARSS